MFETGSFVSLHLNLNEGKMDVFVAHPNINHGMASHVTCFQGIESPVTACICATGEDQKVVQLCSTLSGAGVLGVYQSACDLAHLQRGNETLFRCIDTRGVAWRDYPNMSARVAGSKGVEFGDIVRVIQSRVGTDNNWLLCHAPTIGVKFLPLRKEDSSVPQAEQEVLFVEEDASRDSQDIAMIDSRIIEIPLRSLLTLLLIQEVSLHQIQLVLKFTVSLLAVVRSLTLFLPCRNAKSNAQSKEVG